MHQDLNDRPEIQEETPLQGWKEIAAYLERDERTARRWERDAALPIRRHLTSARSSVYAYPSELKAWRESRPVARAAETAPTEPRETSWRRAAIAAAVVVIGFLVFVRSVRDSSLAEAGAAGDGLRTTELCAGCDTLGAVSPDGRYLSETDWETSGEIGIRDLQTGDYRRLGDKESWDQLIGEADSSRFSPDGQRIAYSWVVDYDGEIGYELRVIEAFGDDPSWSTIYRNPEIPSIYPTGWVEDDRLLVEFRGKDWSRGIGFVTISTGDLQVIRSVDRRVSGHQLSPDGRWIAYDAAAQDGQHARDIQLLASDGSLSKRLTTHRANDFTLGFTPDSKALLFASDRTGSYGLWRIAISPEGNAGEPKLLMRDLGPVHSLGVSRDGSLFYARDLGSEDLFRAELDSSSGRLAGEPTMVRTAYQGANSGPWLSPDGSRLAYYASPGVSRYTRGSPPKLVIHDLSSATDSEIPTGGMTFYPFWDLDWSPDGERLVFPARGEKGRWAYYVVDVESKTSRKIVAIEKPRPTFWAGDGKTLFFAQEESRDGARVSTYLRLGPDDLEPREVQHFPAEAEIARMAISPARDRIAWREARKWIKVMPIEGGEPRVVLERQPGQSFWVQDIAWTPDGRSLLLEIGEEGGGSRIWIAPLDGGEARKTDLAAVGLKQLGMHPDGKTVFYKAGTSDTRIFKTENYLPSGGGTTE